MTLEIVYWIALGLGVLFLLGSIVFGDVFDFLDFDIDIGGDLSATPVLFTALAGFGAGGLLGIKAFELSDGASVLAGLGTSIVLAAMALLLFRALAKQEGASFGIAELVGARGRCVLAIKAGKEGRVSIQHAGMTRTFTASSSEDIATGQLVTVTATIGNALEVRVADVSAEGGEA